MDGSGFELKSYKYAILEGMIRIFHNVEVLHFLVIRLQFTIRWLKQAENPDSQEGILF